MVRYDIDYDLWREVVKPIPEGFTISFSSSVIFLEYFGSGYKELTELGGNKSTGKSASLCGYDIQGEDSDEGRRKVKNFIQRCIRETQKKLSK